jgi:hypothetical protein
MLKYGRIVFDCAFTEVCSTEQVVRALPPAFYFFCAYIVCCRVPVQPELRELRKSTERYRWR